MITMRRCALPSSSVMVLKLSTADSWVLPLSIGGGVVMSRH